MDCSQALQELEAHGTEQNRKVYRRHGAREPLFGVSFANLGKLAKKIGRDQALAGELWASGNADARYLAVQIADPAAVTASRLDAWARDLDHYVIADMFARHVVAPSAHARVKIKKWTGAKAEWVASAGWATLANLAMAENDLDDEYFRAFIPVIEQGIGRAANRVRHEMNGALIALATRSDALAAEATAAAQRIGKVEVDHGETGCKTPDAAPYIAKARSHRKQKADKRAAQKTASGKGPAATSKPPAKSAPAAKSKPPAKGKSTTTSKPPVESRRATRVSPAKKPAAKPRARRGSER